MSSRFPSGNFRFSFKTRTNLNLIERRRRAEEYLQAGDNSLKCSRISAIAQVIFHKRSRVKTGMLSLRDKNPGIELDFLDINYAWSFFIHSILADIALTQHPYVIRQLRSDINIFVNDLMKIKPAYQRRARVPEIVDAANTYDSAPQLFLGSLGGMGHPHLAKVIAYLPGTFEAHSNIREITEMDRRIAEIYINGTGFYDDNPNNTLSFYADELTNQLRFSIVGAALTLYSRAALGF